MMDNLASPQGQQQVKNELNAQSFVYCYNLKQNSPDNFWCPKKLKCDTKKYILIKRNNSYLHRKKNQMNKKHHILIIDDVHSLFMSKLSGYSMEYVPDISEGVLWDAMQEATILVMRSKLNMTADWINRAPKLKLIARLGSGMDNIDVDYATTQGIHCINAPEGNRNAVAEQAVGTMLTLLSNVYKGDREISQGVWDRKAMRAES